MEQSVRPITKNKLLFGQKLIDPSFATDHFLIAGTAGSGKSVLIKRFLYSLFKGRFFESNRLFLYDPKPEFLNYILHSEFGVQGRVKLLQPFLKDSHYWAVWEDVRTPAAALELASIFVPNDQPTSDAFWLATPRQVLQAVMAVFNIRGIQWDLRDLLCAALNDENLRNLLKSDVRVNGEPVLVVETVKDMILKGHHRTVDSILMSLASQMLPFEPLAAAFAKARAEGRPGYSLTSWASSSDILVLCSDELHRESMRHLNSVLFERMAQILLHRPDLPFDDVERAHGLSWVVIDEAREAGNLPALGRLLLKGRSKGVAVLIAFQDVHGLYDSFRENRAKELLGMCKSFAFLKLMTPETAEWASRWIGSQYRRVWVGSRSENIGTTEQRQAGASGASISESDSSTLSESVSQQIQSLPFYEAFRFLYMPSPREAGGICGVFRYGDDSSEIPQECLLPWPDLVRPYLFESEEDAYKRRDGSTLYLTMWSKSELSGRLKPLGLDRVPPPSQEPQPQKKAPAPQTADDRVKVQKKEGAIRSIADRIRRRSK